MRALLRTSVGLAAVCGFVCGGMSYAQERESATAGEGHDHAHAAIGKPAPMFTLADSTGQKHILEDLLKKNEVKAVVLEWFNHNCPICARHGKGKTMSTLASKYKDKGVVWFGVDATNFHKGKESEINEAVKKWGVNYPILTDFDGKIGHLYGAKTTPHMFVIDKKGTLVYEGAIDDDPRGGKSPSERTNYIATALDQLLAGETVATARTKAYGCSVKYKQ